MYAGTVEYRRGGQMFLLILSTPVLTPDPSVAFVLMPPTIMRIHLFRDENNAGRTCD